MTTMNALRTGLLTGAVSLLAACGGGGDGGETENLAGKQATYTIGGTVSGLTITTGQPVPTVVVANQVTGTPITTVTVSGNTAFTFAAATPGTSYVLALTSPAGYACEFSNANNSGAVGSASVNNIDITCTPGEQLHLATLTPPNGSTGIARDTALTASFLSALNPNTVNTNTVSLLSAVGAERIVPSASGNQISVQASDGALLPATTYTLNIANQIRGANGQLPAAPVVSTFTTRDGAWNTFAPFGNVAYPDPAQPQIAMDGSDSAWAVWTPRDNISTQVPRIVRYANGAWSAQSPPHVPFMISANDPIHALIAVNGLGDKAFIWNNDNDVVASIYPRTAGQWTAQQTLSASTELLLQKKIAVDNDGNALAVWIREIGGIPTIFSRRYDSGAQTWGAVVQLESNARTNLNVALNAQGDAVVAWAKSESGQTNFYARMYTRAANAWSNAARIDTQNSFFVSGLKTVIDESRNVLAVWYGNDGTGITTWHNRYDGGSGNWESSAILGIDRNGENSDPKLAINANGNAFAVWWHRSAADRYSVHSRRYSAATRTWSATLPVGAVVIDNQHQNLTTLDVGIDAAGNAIAVRLHGTFNVNHFAVHRYVAAANTWEVSNLTRSTIGHGGAVLAMHPRGNALIAVSDFAGSEFGLEFAAFR